MHYSIVLLMLSCSLSLCGAAVILDGGWPIMWSHTISEAKDLEKAGDTLLPDPWNFLERMSLYKILISSTDPYMASMGTGENQSPLWGLPLQLGWMFNSGRLEDPVPDGQCGQMVNLVRGTCISPNSWYGCVNYFSSVLPFLSAAKQSLVAQGFGVQMKSVPGVEEYCTTYDECLSGYASVMTSWDNFFNGLKESVNAQVEENVKKDILLGLYWTANMASTQATTFCDTRLPLYTAEERAFAEGWRNVAEYVAAVHFQSSLSMASLFMNPLPGRKLQAGDSAPDIQDLSAEENHVLRVFGWIKTANTVFSLGSMWRGYMCSVEARESGRDLLQSFLTNQTYTFDKFTTLINSMSPC